MTPLADPSTVGRWILIFGLILAGVGGLLWLAGRSGLPLGRLAGDFRFEIGGVTCFFPLATSILISLILTILLNVVARWLAK
jgi:hypothetical protein